MATLMLRHRSEVRVYEESYEGCMRLTAAPSGGGMALCFCGYPVSRVYPPDEMPIGAPLADVCRLLAREERLELVTLNGSVVWSLDAERKAAAAFERAAADEELRSAKTEAVRRFRTDNEDAKISEVAEATCTTPSEVRDALFGWKPDSRA